MLLDTLSEFVRENAGIFRDIDDFCVLLVHTHHRTRKCDLNTP